MAERNLSGALEELVREWPGMVIGPHRFGGIEFRVDRREVGHMHLGGMLDLPFPWRVRRELVAAGRAQAHHMLPNTGWVTFRLRTEHDLPAAVALLRMNYERLRGVQGRIGVLPAIGNLTLVDDRDLDDRPV